MIRKRDGLTVVDIKRWWQAAQSGQVPVEINKENGQLIQLKLPLARSDGAGLTFTLSRAGTASWILRYRHGGRAKEVTLGNYPDIGLSEARVLAREKRVEIDGGGDPAHSKRQAKVLAKNSWTVSRLIDDYCQVVLVTLGNSTQRSYGRNLVRIRSKLGTSFVSDVGPLDIVNMLEAIDVGWTERRMLLGTVRMLFRHATGRRLVAVNPAVGVELSAIIGRRPPIRPRLMLAENELQALMNAEMADENLLALKVLLATAVRSDELRQAKWEHIDLEAGTWFVPSTKTGREVTIPLVPQVKTLFAKLKRLAGNSAYVLPARAQGRMARNGGDAPINPNTLGAAIDYWLKNSKPIVNRFTPHDLRSTAKSHMRRLGVSREITEMCLNHALPGVEGIYDRHGYFEERKEALKRWCDYLSKIGPLSAAAD